ncbi:hypothetical protein MXD59_13040 [Frankia sp. Ag45/Mut15]|uniref:Fructose-bisphosphate aldolase n=1 Tax=Frankia umida TaxID=573489 RepID=A0ABT0JYR5_9ACTN|nr:hypothetical protein [Frankia umida]MCK9876691.1 hypothetical protein [Frankia umida]
MPFDDDLIHGPYGGLADPVEKLRQVTDYVDAILGFRKLHDLCVDYGIRIPFIMNLTASTVRGEHTRKVAIGSVEAALQTGCDAVAVHVNFSSRFESSMLEILGRVGEECDHAGMPLLAIMYPRSERAGAEDNYQALKAGDRESYSSLLAHCVRIAADLGADMIKTQYSGDPESFQPVVAAALGVPIIVAGGPKIVLQEALANARGAIDAGAAGVCFGRNTYNRTDASGFARQLSDIVHRGAMRPASPVVSATVSPS